MDSLTIFLIEFIGTLSVRSIREKFCYFFPPYQNHSKIKYNIIMIFKIFHLKYLIFNEKIAMKYCDEI